MLETSIVIFVNTCRLLMDLQNEILRHKLNSLKLQYADSTVAKFLLQ
jgi:hypothetical protein